MCCSRRIQKFGEQLPDAIDIIVRSVRAGHPFSVAIGLVAAFWLTRTLDSMLVDVSAIDPISFTVAAVVLLLVSLAAILVPSLRATRLDPMIALKE